MSKFFFNEPATTEICALSLPVAPPISHVQRNIPEAEVRVKPMQTNGLNSDASKSDREKLNRMLEEMFDESDMWLVNEY